MMISKDPKEIVRDAKASIRRNVTVIKSRLRLLSIPAKELVMQSFVRSLLLYFTVPLVAAKMLSLKEVDSIEREYFREILNAPQDLKREIMMNVAQQGKPASETINGLVSKLKFTKTYR